MKIKNDPTIINWTPISIRDGELPYRIVVRNVGGVKPYSCHYENMKLESSNNWVHESFYYGQYFQTEYEATEEFELRKKSFGR